MKKIINGLAYISLVMAFVIGHLLADTNQKNKIKQLDFIVENHYLLEELDSEDYLVQSNDSLLGYLATGEAQGYGGPLSMAVFADTTGAIIQTALINSYETPSFLAKLDNKKYYSQYENMLVHQRFDIGDYIDVVSGATVSSVAIANATREASYKISENVLNRETPSINKQFRFSYLEGIAVAMFLLGTLFVFMRRKKLRYITLFFGLIFFGFVFNASLSLTHFGRIILGYFPDIYTHFIWWMLMAGTLSIIIVWGKNVYCHALCPFHATQIVLNRISGINLKLSSTQAKWLNKTPGVLLWLSLLLIFLSSNPTIASYEPFALLFSLEGAGIQWYILPTSLIGALFFSNFFCRFFCPVGGALRWIQRVRKQIINRSSLTN